MYLDGCFDGEVDHPWNWESNADVEEVASNRAAQSHVSESFGGHQVGSDQIRDTGASCQQSQTHYAALYVQQKTNALHPPHLHMDKTQHK